MSVDTRRARVRASKLLAIEPFHSTEETRFYLCGTHIMPHPEGALLVATNGHWLVVLLDRGAEITGLPAIWNHQAKARIGKQLAEWKKTYLGFDFWVELESSHAGGFGSFTVKAEWPNKDQEPPAGSGDLLFRAEEKGLEIDGTYPEWQRVLPRMPALPTKDGIPAYQGAYLEKFAKLSKALCAEGSEYRSTTAPVSIWSNEASAPSWIIFPDEADAVGVLMPLRTSWNSAAQAIPPWLTEQVRPAEKPKDETVVPLKKAA